MKKKQKPATGLATRKSNDKMPKLAHQDGTSSTLRRSTVSKPRTAKVGTKVVPAPKEDAGSIVSRYGLNNLEDALQRLEQKDLELAKRASTEDIKSEEELKRLCDKSTT